MTKIVFLCTGNAARSVMARVMFEDRTDGYDVRGAGTHVIEGLPMSRRTRAALERHGLADPSHRSRQFAGRDTDAALIVAMEPGHVEWIRRQHPDVADRTAQLKLLVRKLEPAGLLATRIKSMDLATAPVDAGDEVIDPAGGEQPEFDACADELITLVDLLIERLP